ncbi:hypothetical protein KAJ41_01965 [Candidatus Parcubacteria bacterium]|nr:hypothetical protein [Candidatus Parcubacteria bacterium]
MQEIIELYEKSAQKNLNEINQILKQRKIDNKVVGESCNQILSMSCRNIAQKWTTGRKYLRTFFVKEAFADFYPKNILETSTYVDVMINILDDLLDEKMDDNNKKLYVLEFLRVFSLYNYECPTKEFQMCLGSYFNKLISLAVTEECYKDLIDKEKELAKIVKYSIEVLDCRSMDIDIFNELVFVNNNLYDLKEEEQLMRMGRLFRAVNIMKKDIMDIEHDNETGQESLVSKMTNRKSFDMSAYVLTVADYYISEADKIISRESNKEEYTVPLKNFYNMIKTEKEMIINLDLG